MNSKVETLAKIIKQKINNKKTPKIGWRRSGTLPFFPLEHPSVISGTDTLYSQIIAILEVENISLKLTQQIRTTADRYNINKIVDLGSPNESEIEASLLWLTNGCLIGEDEFKNRFKTLDADTKDRLAMVDFPDNLDVMNADEIEPYKLLTLIKKVVDYSINKDRSKRKSPSSSMRQLIYSLCDIYFQITNQKPGITFDPVGVYYAGKFYNFIELILKEIDPKIISKIKPKSLGRTITAICSFYKKNN